MKYFFKTLELILEYDNNSMMDMDGKYIMKLWGYIGKNISWFWN